MEELERAVERCGGVASIFAPGVACEAALFETDHATWVLSVMARDLADWGTRSPSAGAGLRAEAARAVFGRWHRG